MRLGSLGIKSDTLHYLMSRRGAEHPLLDGSPSSVIVNGPRRVLVPFATPSIGPTTAAVVASMPSDFLPSRYKRRAPITDAMLDETCDLRRLRQLKVF